MKKSIQERIKEAYKSDVIVELFYRKRIEKIGELMILWGNSDSWKDGDCDKCGKHLQAISKILLSGIKEKK